LVLVIDAVDPQRIDAKTLADLNRKRQLLEAAAQFLREWNRIQFEALTEPEERAENGQEKT
jgi:hypothetical protein